MKNANTNLGKIQTVAWAALLALGLCTESVAATTDLASAPLATASNATVRPNLLFTLDDSGSMGWNYLPDYAGGGGSGTRNHCKVSNTCSEGETPFMTNEYNGVAYNPRITYQPAVNADSTLMTAQDCLHTGGSATGCTAANGWSGGWTTVKKDAFGVQSTGTINLLTSYPEVVYSTSSTSTVYKKNGIDTNNPFSLRAAAADDPPVYAFPGNLTEYVSGSTPVNLFSGTWNTAGTTTSTIFDGAFNVPTGGNTIISLSNEAVSHSGNTVTVTYSSQTPSTPLIAVGDTLSVSGNQCSKSYRDVASTILSKSGNSFTYLGNASGTNWWNKTTCTVVVTHAGAITPASPPSISSDNTTVTVTLSSPHGLTTGNVVTVGNASTGTCDSGYKGTSMAVTVVNSTTFTYSAPAVVGTATSSSCKITTPVPLTPSSPGLSRSGNVVTVTLTGHGLVTGDLVQMSNVSYNSCGSGYRTNGSVSVTVIDANTFTYTPTAGTSTSGLKCSLDHMTTGLTPVINSYTHASTRNGAPYYFIIVPVEYCDSIYLTKCVASPTPTTVGGVSYSFPAPVRFCKDATTANLPPGDAGAQTSSGGTNTCQAKFSVGTGINFQYARYGLFYRVDIDPARTTYGDEVLNGTIDAYGVNMTFNNVTVLDRAGRTDCAAAPNCTYDEEMTNFANWYAYYRTRMQMMKTSAGRAFSTLDDRYRVGFATINYSSTRYLAVNKFDPTQKTSWYSKFYAINPGNSTPLRSALARAGRYFAGLKPDSISDDPMEYSCQQNFLVLTTDGYWNGPTPVQLNGTSSIGNQDNVDSGLSARSLGVYDGGLSGASDTLADTAQYYYKTDLRTSALGNCTGALGTDVCLDNVPTTDTDTLSTQHMVTYSLGLADGLMTYTSDYESSKTGDFASIKSGATGCPFSGSGTCNWPLPASNGQTALDDLWHAAVNGRGTYYNARDPVSLSRGLTNALAGINVQLAAAAASSTSSPNITQTDRSIFSSTYRTTKWDGEVVAQYIDPTTGTVTAVTTRNTIGTASSITMAANGDVTVTLNNHGLKVNDFIVVYNSGTGTCDSAYATTAPAVITSATANTFTYAGNAAGSTVNAACAVDVVPYLWSAQGQLDAKVAADATADISSRAIYTYTTNTATWPTGLKPFKYVDLTATEQGYFSNKCAFATLSQCTAAILTSAQLASGNDGTNVVNYLRGQKALESTTPNPVFRPRDHILGDTVNAKPAYLRAPQFSFTDAVTPTYASFKTANASRQGMLYVAANDGMLHAFNADTGNEVWSFVPNIVMPDLYRLADTNYSNNHRFYVDGSPELMDIFVDSATSTASGLSVGWHTILVAGLNLGGRGYYALDVTDPANPRALWEICSDSTLCANSDADMGYSYGNPVITKRSRDGKWVVLVTSGYNNVSPGTGLGYLYELDAATGTVLSKTSTGSGSTTTPSGFAKISAWSDNGSADNTSRFVYGGDLNGDVWRFDLGAVGSVLATSVDRIATLQDAVTGGNAQPVTTRPELADVLNNVNSLTGVGNPVLYVGTGRFLGNTDKANVNVQSFYAIKDDLSKTGTAADLGNLRARLDMVHQTLTQTTSTTRTTSQTTVDWAAKKGWYLDFNVVDPVTGLAASPGERVNIDPVLALGTLIVITNVPESSACTVGGYSWLYQFDFKNGTNVATAVDQVAGSRIGNALTVGVVVVRLPSGQLKAITTSASGSKTTEGVHTSGTTSTRRVSWRELVQ
ncbi:MAG: PQQ-binding-like beta-propeller repeat protein [Sideroxydans sp.]|nr:PQQ-binding-like beta-propeller repeat protein [Sideroxydans sp.]